MPGSGDFVDPSKFTVVYGVLREKPMRGKPVLPFFSLVTFRYHAKELDALGFKYAFAWILKEKASEGRKKKRKNRKKEA
ncbi:hypothetical protein X731_03780 [Mesorhizobium sp. L2C054A000]|nr:hypothetical protein X731_03780 [Mesorhizobium sp. L2C054A000]